MKTFGEWFEKAMGHVKLSCAADSVSELRSDLEDAVAAFDQALALDPDHAQACAEKGRALARMDQHEAAAAALARAVTLAPARTEFWLEWSSALASLDRHNDALKACDEVLRREPNEPNARFRKAEMLSALGRHEDALAAWNMVLRAPDNRTFDFHGRTVKVLLSDVRRQRARLSRAGALAGLGWRDESIAAYREIIESGEMGLQRPLFHQALRDVEPARAAYHEHLGKHAGDPRKWQLAGSDFLCAQRTNEALNAYEKMISAVPGEADAWSGKAEALMQAGRYEEALRAYRESLVLRPGHLGVLSRAGVALKKLGLPDNALAAGELRWRVIGCDRLNDTEYCAGDFATESEALDYISKQEKLHLAAQDAYGDTYRIVLKNINKMN